MKKLFIAATLFFVAAITNAQLVSHGLVTPNSTADPLCRNYHVSNHPKFCKNHLYGSYPCDLCPVCDENGQLVKCSEGDLPANGNCCLDTRIDLNRLNQLPAYCKINEGQAHPCGQCPVYYEKPKDTCVTCTGELGQTFPCCFLHNGPGGDGTCPGSGYYKSDKPGKTTGKTKPNKKKNTKPAKKSEDNSKKK